MHDAVRQLEQGLLRRISPTTDPAEPAWIEISASALAANVRALRARIAARTEIIAVVKSNAYGHGVALVAPELAAGGIDAFGVNSVREAVELRLLGAKVPIHVMGYISPQFAEDIVHFDLCPIVSSLETARALNVAGKALEKTVTLSVKVETGMNRLGLRGRELDRLMRYLAGARYLNVVGLTTHFARADTADPTLVEKQFALFTAAVGKYRALGHKLDRCHAAATASTMLYPKTHMDAVRVGIGLYGLYPSAEVRLNSPGHTLRPVLEYKTRIVETRRIEAGESVSYGATWTAKRPSRIAILPVGYADGYPRALSGRGHVLVRSARAPIIGRICMNMFMIDVTDFPAVARHDEVTLIGADPVAGVTADDIAQLVGTVNYEILTNLPTAIPRIAVR